MKKTALKIIFATAEAVSHTDDEKLCSPRRVCGGP